MNFRKTGLIVAGVLLAGLLLLNHGDVTLTKQDQFELNPISSAGYELQSTLHLYNPNLLSSTIKGIREDFYLNGILVGTFSNEINQGIPGRKETGFPINIRFDTEAYNQALISDSMNLNVVITGEIIYQNLSGGGKIKVQQRGSIPVKKL